MFCSTFGGKQLLQMIEMKKYKEISRVNLSNAKFGASFKAVVNLSGDLVRLFFHGPVSTSLLFKSKVLMIKEQDWRFALRVGKIIDVRAPNGLWMVVSICRTTFILR